MVSKTYFVRVHPAISLVIIMGLFVHIPLMAFARDYLELMGPVGQVSLSLSEPYVEWLQQFFKICMYVHVGEAVIGLLLCLSHGLSACTSLKWTLSVFVNGMFAMRFLIWPIEEEITKKKKK